MFWLGCLISMTAAVVLAAPSRALADGPFMWNGQQCGTWGKDSNTGTFHVDNCNAFTAPTPTPVPTSTPVGTQTSDTGCPAGYTVLNVNLTFAGNTFGLDLQSVPPGSVNHYCAILPLDVAVLKVRTADRSGPSQCSNITLTVTPPASSGIRAKSSNATNNSINIYGITPPSYLVPAGVYLIDTAGGTPLVGCSTNQYMVYWQY